MFQRGIWFAGEMPVPRMVGLAQHAEAAGVDSVWMAEGYYARDGFVPLAAMAAATSRVKVGTSVVNPYTRHPAVLAMSFATLDELSGGRALVGIGAGARHQVEGQMGYEASRPYTAVRESLDILELMATGRQVDYTGKVFRADGVRLVIQGARPLPTYIAAVGPRMCRLAGERGAGVFLPQTSATFVRRAIGLVAEGAEAAGRDPHDVDVAAMLILAVADDAEAAHNDVRVLLGILLLAPESERILEENDLDPAIAQQLRDAFDSGGMRALAGAVSSDVILKLAIAGPPGYCRDKLDELVDAGVTHPVISMVGSAPEAALEVLMAVEGGSA